MYISGYLISGPREKCASHTTESIQGNIKIKWKSGKIHKERREVIFENFIDDFNSLISHIFDVFKRMEEHLIPQQVCKS